MDSDSPILNGNMSRRVTMDTLSMEWTASPSGTVWRKRLHLVGGSESGQVTSVVRYEAGASFPAHDHPDGEEILVLEGTFSDEHGDWPAGTHLLNPEGFRHAPFSRDGCVLFVKLRQYAGDGRDYRKANTHTQSPAEVSAHPCTAPSTPQRSATPPPAMPPIPPTRTISNINFTK